MRQEKIAFGKMSKECQWEHLMLHICSLCWNRIEYMILIYNCIQVNIFVSASVSVCLHVCASAYLCV